MFCRMFLGLEGSANKIGIGLFDGDSIVYNERRTYTGAIGEGFMPKEVAKHHRDNVCDLLSDAFNNYKLSSLTAVCYTRGPGMAPSLISVAIAARLISLLSKKPLVPVNHCIAHIEMGRFETGSSNPVILYVSGGNTQVIGFCNGKYRILGETIDIALGNCLDRAARLLKIDNYPSPGYNIEQEAKRYRIIMS